MINVTKIPNPGTFMSCADASAQYSRRGTGMGWTNLGSFAPGRTHDGEPSVFGAIAVRDSLVAARTYVQATVDLPTIKQFRVPLSLRERSP
ncbi:MAG: hypothetical protein JWQ81_8039 [Amycolatopsis sp.]|jgi:hypothetical protein|uniref:hypothetical protein n=1 Tax=Amycolatopsis sp. TaxID=37632 RepID=UPI002605C957|nr:hypothetical protein [Amycolatopsis sp.]MCU1687300.1 hypothetical protein [Amycolatopsis sp.]